VSSRKSNPIAGAARPVRVSAVRNPPATPSAATRNAPAAMDFVQR
jgi:hypothetical protein